MNFEDFLSQDLRLIKKKLTVEYINKEDDDTFLYFVLMEYLSLCKLKYIFKFCIRNLPFVFLDKDTFDYFVDYHDEYYETIIENTYILDFYKYNFPEVSYSTNNFILPLTMEIEN